MPLKSYQVCFSHIMGRSFKLIILPFMQDFQMPNLGDAQVIIGKRKQIGVIFKRHRAHRIVTGPR